MALFTGAGPRPIGLPFTPLPTLAMPQPNLVRQRFLAELNEWLTPGLLYHCFTGESDPCRLAHVEGLQSALQGPLLNKVERQWPERLRAIDAERISQKQQSKALVRSYVQASIPAASLPCL